MADTESALLGHLEFLYGPDAGSVLDELLRLMRSFEDRITSGPAEPLTEKDAVLITYGDMVHEPGRPPLASLGDFLAGHIDDVINTVHILPFYPYSSDDGFSVIDYLQVDPALGDWGDLDSTRRSFRLMFDAVLNHISAESEWFLGYQAGNSRFRDFFTVVEPGTDLSAVFRPRDLPLLTEVQTVTGRRQVWTTFSTDQIDLNYRNPSVLLEAINTLLFYVSQGAAFIRLDAIAFIWKEVGTSCIHLPETHRIIQLIRSVLEQVAPGVIIITETNVPHDENVSYFGDGRNEAHMVYNFALPPLTLHAFHTGSVRVLSHWAGNLEAPTAETTFFNFLASHDGIGVGGARGLLSETDIDRMADRIETLGGKVSYRTAADGTRRVYELNVGYIDALGKVATDEPGRELAARRFLTSQAIMLSLQGVPGIYFHSLFGSRGWHAGVDQTGLSRTINREKLNLGELELELDAAKSLRHLVFRGYRQLLLQRASSPAFSPDADQHVIQSHPAVFTLLRIAQDGGTFALCLHNVSSQRCIVPIDLSVTPINQPMELIDMLGGEIFHLQDGVLSKEIEPYQTLWLTGST